MRSISVDQTLTISPLVVFLFCRFIFFIHSFNYSFFIHLLFHSFIYSFIYFNVFVYSFILFFHWLFLVSMTARSYLECHLLAMRNFTDFTAICWATSEVVHHFVNNDGFRSCETLNLYICSEIWGPTRHLSLKITNSLAILRLTKPLKTSTRLAGTGI